jgi:hypothetical protein
MRRVCFSLPILVGFVIQAGADVGDVFRVKVQDNGSLAIHVQANPKPFLVQNAPPDGRPYIHPLLDPNEKGILTEFSPAHHKHQTGIYVGILKVNGRDYFHNRDGNYIKRKEVPTAAWRKEEAKWFVAYDWLGKDKETVLTERQNWKLTLCNVGYTLDLDWSATAAVDVTCEKYDYGGLFVRMPWTAKTGGEAVNSDGKKNGAAEGQRARWVDIGMPIEGRDDWGHIAILDHKDNPGHPIVWRVDGQLGVGPARSRLGEWKIPKGETARAKYRLFVYTGKTDAEKVEASWKEFNK